GGSILNAIGGSVINAIQQRAGIWNNGTLIDFGGGSANDVNNIKQENSATNGNYISMQVAGSLGSNDGAAIWLLNLYENGTNNIQQIQLPTVGVKSTATSINDLGESVGWLQDGLGELHAALWTDQHNLINLGEVTSDSNSYARDINNSGLIVGYSVGGYCKNSYCATIWGSDHTATDLNSLLDESTKSAGWELIMAQAVNDSGLIVGNAFNNITGVTHAFVLTPTSAVPEPNTFSLMLFGIVSLVTYKARRRK
ncbi:PEP-CTERM sorting domain-containing protein, partial [Methylotenera sp.]|uniref:PEP-CTERM sorting domain-containing protein n=1 Tax=Methylotenera sp. TaxID=2051956 RepID=UPI002489BADA